MENAITIVQYMLTIHRYIQHKPPIYLIWIKENSALFILLTAYCNQHAIIQYNYLVLNSINFQNKIDIIIVTEKSILLV